MSDDWRDKDKDLCFDPTQHDLYIRRPNGERFYFGLASEAFHASAGDEVYLEFPSPHSPGSFNKDVFLLWAYRHGLYQGWREIEKIEELDTALRYFLRSDETGRLRNLNFYESLKEEIAAQNSVFMDATTLDTAKGLILANSVIPIPNARNLFDLATFVTCIVLFDHIYHLPGTPLGVLNRSLGEEIFKELPVRDKEAQWCLWRLWSEVVTRFPTEKRSEQQSKYAYSADELNEIRRIWEEVLNFSPIHFSVPSHYELREAMNYRTPPQFIRIYQEQFMQRSAESNLLIVGATVRTIFNRTLARWVGLPYVTNSIRAPLDRFFAKRSLGSMESVDRIMAFLDNTAALPQGPRPYKAFTNLELPAFLTVLLRRLEERNDDLSHFIEELRWLRRKSEPYRAKFANFRRLIRMTSPEAQEEAWAIINSLQKDKEDLFGWVEDWVITHLLLIPVENIVGGQIGLIAGIGFQALLGLAATDKVQNLAIRVFRPELDFVNNVRECARSIINSNEMIKRLWGSALSYSEIEFLERLLTQWSFPSLE